MVAVNVAFTFAVALLPHRWVTVLDEEWHVLSPSPAPARPPDASAECRLSPPPPPCATTMTTTAVIRISHNLTTLESFEWLHRWHGHDKARRVAIRSVGILVREGEREIGRSLQVRHANRGEDHNQFLSVQHTCAALVGDQVFTP